MNDYYNKYLKYKKKYLGLKKEQNGGYINDESFSIDGASSMYYFSNIKGKKILLFGEHHITSSTCSKQNKVLKNMIYQTDIIRFINYLEKQNEKNNSCLDFILESEMVDKNISAKNYSNIIGFDRDLIKTEENYFDKNQLTAFYFRGENNSNLSSSRLLEYYYIRSNCGVLKNIKNKNLFFKNNKNKFRFIKKCKKGFRVHLFDLFKIKSDKNIILHPFSILYDLTLSQEKPVINDFLKKKYNLEFKDDKFNFNYINSIFIYLVGKKKDKNYEKGKKYFNEIYDYLVLSKIVLNYQKNLSMKIMTKKEVLNTSNKIQKQMKNIDKKYLKEDDIYKYFELKLENFVYKNKNFLNNIYILTPSQKIINFLRIALTDIYSICRMFRNFKPKRKIVNCEGKKSMKNIIYYAGETHTNDILDFIKWKFKVEPDLNINNNLNNKIDQCLVVPTFKPFDFKMPWNNKN